METRTTLIFIFGIVCLLALGIVSGVLIFNNQEQIISTNEKVSFCDSKLKLELENKGVEFPGDNILNRMGGLYGC